MFDPTSFLDQSTEQANDTVQTPIPVGEYTGVIDKLELKEWTSTKNPGDGGWKLSITWLLDDPSVKEFLGRDKVTVRQEIMLDIDDGGRLDMGKGRNVGLGKLRAATDLNVPGQPFAPSQLQGQIAKIVIKHRMDPKDSEKVYSEVGAVAHV